MIIACGEQPWMDDMIWDSSAAEGGAQPLRDKFLAVLRENQIKYAVGSQLFYSYGEPSGLPG